MRLKYTNKILIDKIINYFRITNSEITLETKISKNHKCIVVIRSTQTDSDFNSWVWVLFTLHLLDDPPINYSNVNYRSYFIYRYYHCDEKHYTVPKYFCCLGEVLLKR